MRTHTDVVAERLDAADMTAQSTLRSAAQLVAQQFAEHDRVRRVVGVKRTRRDFGAACAGLVVLMASSYATAIDDQ